MPSHIEDHALIGDRTTAALVGGDARIVGKKVSDLRHQRQAGVEF